MILRKTLGVKDSRLHGKPLADKPSSNLSPHISRLSTNPYQGLRRQIFVLRYPISARTGGPVSLSFSRPLRGADSAPTYQADVTGV